MSSHVVRITKVNDSDDWTVFAARTILKPSQSKAHSEVTQHMQIIKSASFSGEETAHFTPGIIVALCLMCQSKLSLHAVQFLVRSCCVQNLCLLSNERKWRFTYQLAIKKKRCVRGRYF